MNKITAKEIAPIILRIGIALVFLWFGSQQLLNTGMWLKLIPEWILSMSGLAAATIVHFNGAFELVFGIALLIGFQSRIAATLLGLHLISITLDVGYGAVGVRDFGLCMATIALAFYGATRLSIDAWCTKKDMPTVANS